MRIKLGFYGAAQNVTGSRHMVEADGTRVLVDCGLYQERQYRDRNWQRFSVDPKTIDAVLLTHAHLDHCGLLPKLVKDGFRGKIHCTPATAEIAKIILLDAAHLQEEDAAYKAGRHRKEGRVPPYPEVPLYTVQDAMRVDGHFEPAEYGQVVKVADGIKALFCNAGHVLGSSMITLNVRQDGQSRNILFSGDVGRRHMPILKDPTVFDSADYVLIESTYGDRVHPAPEDVEYNLAAAVNDAVKAGGNLVIPSFALERSQDLLYHLNRLLEAKRISELPVFLDSPMAIRITEVFRNHPELYDKEMAAAVRQDRSPFEMRGLKMTLSTEESKAINRFKGPAVIIAGSGMCTGGRVKHHLVNNIGREESIILFIGYQASGTLGRTILDRPQEVRILGQMLPVRAEVRQIHGFSAHADRDELMHWLTGLKKPPRGVFVVHGESGAAQGFGRYVAEKTGWNVTVPSYRDEVVLN